MDRKEMLQKQKPTPETGMPMDWIAGQQGPTRVQKDQHPQGWGDGKPQRQRDLQVAEHILPRLRENLAAAVTGVDSVAVHTAVAAVERSKAPWADNSAAAAAETEEVGEQLLQAEKQTGLLQVLSVAVAVAAETEMLVAEAAAGVALAQVQKHQTDLRLLAVESEQWLLPVVRRRGWTTERRMDCALAPSWILMLKC